MLEVSLKIIHVILIRNMSTNYEIEFFNNLQDISIWFIIITVISSIGIFYLIASILTIISLLLVLIKVNPKLKTLFSKRGGQGILFLPIGYLLQFLVGILELIAAIQGPGRISRIAHGEIGTLLLIGSLVLTFIGYLFVGMDIYDLGARYKDDILKIGGIVIIIPVINFVGWLITYIGAGNVLLRPSSYTLPSVYQVGNAILRYDGSAFFSLYSSQQGIQIANAVIQELGISAIDVQPRLLNAGINTVNVRFPAINTSTPVGLYTLLLTLSTGQNIIVKINLISL